MPILGILTTAWAVTKLWAGVELLGKAALEGTGQQIGRPIGGSLGAWFSQKTGLQDKKREKVFLEAYHKAEQNLIDKIGLASAYRVFRLIPSLVDSDSAGVRTHLILDILEAQSVAQESIINKYQLVQIREGDSENLMEFMCYLRQNLYETPLFRPLIEFYSTEDARRLRNLIFQDMEMISNVIDDEVRAFRVTVVESVDFESEREVYLKQVEAFFEEQDFIGFPELKEQKKSILLKDIYVPLNLKYKDGGEALNDELGELVAIQLSKKED